MYRKTEEAFSLIELAIVLVIMALLSLGGVGAKNLVQQGKLLQLATEIQVLQQASHNFTAKYQALAGDFARASQVISSELVNGDGDGYLGDVTLQQNGSWDFLSHDDVEQRNFLTHLQVAGFLAEMPNRLKGFAVSRAFPHIAIVPRVESAGEVMESMNVLVLVNGPALKNHSRDNEALANVLPPNQLLVLKRRLDGDNCQSGDCLLTGIAVFNVFNGADYRSGSQACIGVKQVNGKPQAWINPQSTRKCSLAIGLEMTMQLPVTWLQ